MRFAACLLAVVLALPALATVTPPSTPMVPIPAGEYTMGRQGSTSHPAHRVKVSAFEMDVHEVTNAQYFAFCQATDRKLPAFWNVERFQCGEAWPDHPVIGVSLGDARAYAVWVGKRLPTEAEWEWAARGGGAGKYGDDLDALAPDQANYKKSPHDAPTVVNSYAPNGYGLHDMIGNVREWTTDYFSTEVPAASLVPESGELDGLVPMVDPTGPEKGHVGVVRGGGWYGGSSCQTVFTRVPYPRAWGDFAVGFRCARDVDEVSYETELQRWHQGRVARLSTIDGWLSLVGLHPLHEGVNSLGTREGLDVVLQGEAPAHVGTIALSDGAVRFEPALDVLVTADGVPVTGPMTAASDADGQATVFRVGTLRFHVISRGDQHFLRVKNSHAATRLQFAGVERYPVDERWRVTARLVTEGRPTEVASINVLGQETMEPSPGVLVFELEGQECRLTPVGEPGRAMFIVFADRTNGLGSYGGGRFLSASAPDAEGRVVLDFNRAVNPPCAFTAYATCPMPPLSNRLMVAVEAGERSTGGHH